ncbi:MAG: glycosyltransferase family A protein [Vicinamibacterales bacterium]
MPLETPRARDRSGAHAGRVSVMMPAFNAERFIARAVGSVLAQTYADWELIVVDDGSTDRTGAIVREFADPRIAIVTQQNRGEAAARNVALDAASGAYLAFLDADDVFLPHHLDGLVACLRAHPGHIGAYTDGHYVDEHERRVAPLSSRRCPPVTGRLFEALVRSSGVFGPPVCVLIRLAPVRAHALRFDERITIGPDWDFFIRYADLGTFGYLDGHTCLYRLHGANISLGTGSVRRLQDLATCRVNAIRMPSFAGCAVAVRVWVFYDLLVNLLAGSPERQQDVFGWPRFRELPGSEQARLLRLAASKTILAGGDRAAARRWLEEAVALDPSSFRARLTLWLEASSPRLCRRVLRLRTASEHRTGDQSPLADLRLAAGGGGR